MKQKIHEVIKCTVFVPLSVEYSVPTFLESGSFYKYIKWMDVTDLAWAIFAGGTVCDTSRAAVQVFEDHFITLDDQLTDTACTAATSNKDESFSPSCVSCHGVNRVTSYQQIQS